MAAPALALLALIATAAALDQLPQQARSRVFGPATILATELLAGGPGVVLEGAADGSSELRCATNFSGPALIVATGDLTLRRLRLTGCVNKPALLISNPKARVVLEGVHCYNNTQVKVGWQLRV
jgi:hypothetical protein